MTKAFGASDFASSKSAENTNIEPQESQVIQPEQINNASIYRVYLSASNGIKKI